MEDHSIVGIFSYYTFSYNVFDQVLPSNATLLE